jgi:SAM-dependent methyltransferase
MSSTAQLAVEKVHPATEQRPHYYARSFGDPISRLFWRDGELWMGLLEPQGAYFEQLMSSGKLDDLFSERFLCPIQKQDVSIEPFQAVYRLERTPRIIYWHEWSPEMLRTAALNLLDLLGKLAKRGLTLRNPHPWNLLFFGNGFSYINPGGIVPLDMETFARSYEKIARFFVRPLVLIGAGLAHIAKRLMEDPQNGVLAEDVVVAQQEWAIWNEANERSAIRPFLKQVEENLARLILISASHRWGSYFETICDFSPGTSWTCKRETLQVLLAQKKVLSVLDIGANSGYYCLQAAEQGCEVIAADFDSVLIDTIFLKVKAATGSVYPAVLDFSHPTPGQGGRGDWFPPATERLKSDLVLFFALAHHLIFGKYRLDFEEIALGIRSFTDQWALIEYIGCESVHPTEWRPDASAWYSVENLATALKSHFSSVQVSTPAKDGRQLLVCGPEGIAL